MPGTPAVFLHGQLYTGRVEPVTLDGRAASLIPLFGRIPPCWPGTSSPATVRSRRSYAAGLP